MNNPTKIPIKNGQFNYTFSVKTVEAFELIFEDEFENGTWVPTLFFSTEWYAYNLFLIQKTNGTRTQSLEVI